ncbi:MAG: DUF937 domain-containing protein [Rhizobiaceae bacterium]
MPTLFDMMNNAQGGKAMELLARQFNLSQQQTQLAVEALMPAFSEGLKRNASDPYGLGSFLTALSSGQHGKYFEDAANAFSPGGMQDGNGILGHLFGSKDLSRAVAAQAAQATGIGQQVLQQMLPAIAAMVMGGLFKQSTGGTQQNAFGSQGFGGMGSNPLGDIIGEMMKQGGGFGMPQQAPSQNQSRQQSDPMDNPLGKMLEGMFGGGRQSERTREKRVDGNDNPLGRMFEEMLGGGKRAPDPEPAREARQKPQDNPSGRARNPYDDLFGDMFDAGSKQRDEYQKNVGNIFDQFLRGMDKRIR